MLVFPPGKYAATLGRPFRLFLGVCVFAFHVKNFFTFEKQQGGRLGGSVGWVSDFGSGHDLTVREFENRVGLWADGSEPGACFRFCVSLSLCPSPVHALSLSVPKIKKNIEKKKV